MLFPGIIASARPSANVNQTAFSRVVTTTLPADETTISDCVVSAYNGSGQFSYLWERASGSTDITATVPGNPTTRFRYQGAQGVHAAVFRCKVTDTVTGSIVYSPDVTISFTITATATGGTIVRSFPGDPWTGQTVYQDTMTVTLGTVFTVSENCQFNGVAFRYETNFSSAQYDWQLWNAANGALLDSGTMPAMSANQWYYHEDLSTYGLITSGSYIVSYFASDGEYISWNTYFDNNSLSWPPINIPEDSSLGVDFNGVFAYSGWAPPVGSPSVPDSTWNNSFYHIGPIIKTLA